MKKLGELYGAGLYLNTESERVFELAQKELQRLYKTEMDMMENKTIDELKQFTSKRYNEIV